MSDEEAQSRLEDQIRSEAELRAPFAEPGWAYSSHQELVLRLGVSHTASLELPAGYRLMAARRCFDNAFNLVSDDPSLYFCEGWASYKGLPWMVQHAWAEDRTGVLIDPTWQSRLGAPDVSACYMGVRFSMDFVRRRAIMTGYAGVISTDYMVDYAALKHGFVIEDGVVVDDTTEPTQRWRSHERVR